MRRHHCTRQKTATQHRHILPTRRMKLQFKVINTCSVGAKSQLSCKACAATDSTGKGSNNADASCAVRGRMGTRVRDWETGRHSESDPSHTKDSPPLSVCPFVLRAILLPTLRLSLVARRTSVALRFSFACKIQTSA